MGAIWRDGERGAAVVVVGVGVLPVLCGHVTVLPSLTAVVEAELLLAIVLRQRTIDVLDTAKRG